ncbi:hypothetical protein K2173_017042 [Erythroxylum novogranatense]|uniref:Uncharacterized protein n=1 Tax=Erythroxylum novogranatense TaxID=1862640 RepID=A0AAV8U5J7_9ROSI|nr:hypothetical protein K2173_017042 [Erythroxylum novogranatense]
MDFLWSKSTQPHDQNTDPDQDFTRIDDDMFYAELKRQVLLLIDEDSEDSSETTHSWKCDSSGLNRSFPAISQPGGSYFSLWDMEIKNSAPTWLVKTWRTGKGTGVFIPQIVKTRSSSRRKSYGRRQVQTHGGLFMVEI